MYINSFYYLMSTMMSTMISWALAACAFVGSWFTFKKMGLPGWKGIIPYYNMYVMFDKVWEKKKFWTYVIFSAVTFVLAIMSVFYLEPSHLQINNHLMIYLWLLSTYHLYP